MNPQKTKYYSYKIGDLPKGCQYCVRGEKLVLFITGLCPRHCYFCPISEKKYQKDVVFANERPVQLFNDIKTEAKLMNAKGAGITGGDPLAKLNRTLNYIKNLKKTFSKKFHIHLYTSLNLINEKNLAQLFQAGLDEIRFHPDLDNKILWPKLSLARKFSWDVGVEVPVIPGKEKELKQLIDFIKDKIDFLNLNELELADTPVSKLFQMGFQPRSQLDYAVKGSRELGLTLLKYLKKKKYQINTHFCTVKLKNAVQLAERIKREAKYSKKPFDQINFEGLLIRGALYSNKPSSLKKLTTIKNRVIKDLKLKLNQIQIDQRNSRILISVNNIKKHKNYFLKLGFKPALVKEYPTYDQLTMELEFLK